MSIAKFKSTAEAVDSIQAPSDAKASSDPALVSESQPTLITSAMFFRQHGEAILTVVCALAIAGGWLTDHWLTGQTGLSGLAAPVLYTISYLAGGYLSARDALRLLLQERELDVDLLMVLAAVGAAAIGHWWEGAVLIFIFSLSGTLETYAMAYTRREISTLMTLNPERTTLLRPDGTTEVVPASTLKIGDQVLVLAGDRIPSDGIVREGASAVDQAAITGESVPVEKAVGHSVFAGTINGPGVITVEITAAREETVLARIIRMVSEAREEKPPTALFIERFERIYARVIVLGAVATALAPPLIWNEPFSASGYRALVLLVAASPCALTMSIMPTLISAIATAAKSGVLLKGGRHLENLAAARCVAFDKTGTLTRGEPRVTDTISFGSDSTEEVLRRAAAVESRSEHPLAAAITSAAEEFEVEKPQSVEVHVGQGITAELSDGRWAVGRPILFGGPGRMTAEMTGAVRDLVACGKTVMLVGPANGPPIGAIAVRDELRSGAAELVSTLKSLGVEVAMLTGDNPSTAEAIARGAGVEEVHAGLLPDTKVERVRELTVRYGRVAMVGDGVNDAPALASASVGIAMGRRGTDVAMETADVVLMGDDLSKLPYAINLGRRAVTIARQNLIFSSIMICLLIISAFTGWLQMALAVVGHEGSTLLVTLNGLRLLRR